MYCQKLPKDPHYLHKPVMIMIDYLPSQEHPIHYVFLTVVVDGDTSNLVPVVARNWFIS